MSDTPLGRRIRKLREERGLSLDQLASKCGVSRAYLWKLEKRPCNPTVDVLDDIAGALKIGLYELFHPKPRALDKLIDEIMVELQNVKNDIHSLYSNHESGTKR